MTTTDAMQFAGPLSGRLSLTGYDLPEGLSYDEWASEGATLGTMARASMWWIGDWIRYGENHYGETYAQAIEMTGLAVQTLTNAVWVCNKIPPEERRESVPFWHHQEIARLEDASSRLEILDRAETEGLTQAETRREVERKQRTDTGAPEPEWCSVRLDDLEVAAATLRRRLTASQCAVLAVLLTVDDR